MLGGPRLCTGSFDSNCAAWLTHTFNSSPISSAYEKIQALSDVCRMLLKKRRSQLTASSTASDFWRPKTKYARLDETGEESISSDRFDKDTDDDLNQGGPDR